jgi:hypothetical protein
MMAMAETATAMATVMATATTTVMMPPPPPPTAMMSTKTMTAIQRRQLDNGNRTTTMGQ